jgi:hypothetical protein
MKQWEIGMIILDTRENMFMAILDVIRKFENKNTLNSGMHQSNRQKSYEPNKCRILMPEY